MSQQIIGKVSIIPCGVFKPNTKYSRLSVVEYLGNYYIAVVDNENIPISNTNVWYLLSEKGEKGEQGIQGEQGEPGDSYNIDPEELQAVVDELASNASSTFNANATNKTNAFNDNATNKTSAFNDNATNKTSAFNDNATNKTSAFNDNVTLKTSTFDSHVQSTIQYFDNEYNQGLTNLEIMTTNVDQNLSTKGDYEEITDGLNSEIKDIVIYGNMHQIETTGKQLFDKSTATYSENNTGLNASGEEVSASGYKYTTSFITVEAETAYTIQGSFNSSSHITRIYYYTSNSEWISRSNTFGTSPYTFTTPANCEKIRFMVYSSLYDDSTLMIEKGSTASTYETFSGGKAAPNPDFPEPINVVTGDIKIISQNANFYNYEDTTNVGSGVYADSNGWINITYDNSAGTSTVFRNYFTNKLTLKDSYTYTIVLEIKSVSGDAGLYLTNNLGQFPSDTIYSFSDLSNNQVIVVRKTTRKKYNGSTGLRSYGYFQAGKSGSITFRISVLDDSTITPETFKYIPYKGNKETLNLGSMELCKIGDYQDKIFKAVVGDTVYDGLTAEQKATLTVGSWYKYKAIEKHIMAGNESFSIQNGCFVTSSITDVIKDDNATGLVIVLCNKYKGYTFRFRDGVPNYGVARTVHGTKVQIAFRNNDFSTVQEFVDDITGAVIYYILATPVFEEITDTTLLGELNRLLNFETYKGMTYIVAIANDVNPYVQVLYMENPLSSIISRLDLLEG